MGLKESGLRGSLRNVSVDIVAIPDSVVDNFEESDADPAGPYGDGDDLSTFYSGSLDQFDRTTSGPAINNHAVSTDAPNTNDHGIVSNEGDGLPRYPEPEETVKALLKGDSSRTEPGLLFTAKHDENDDEITAYGVIHRPTQDDWQIYKYQNAAADELSEGRDILETNSVSLSTDDYYWYEVDTPDENGNFEVRVYELDNGERGSEVDSSSQTDTDIDHTQRGVGMFIGHEGSGGRIDEIEVLE